MKHGSVTLTIIFLFVCFLFQGTFLFETCPVLAQNTDSNVTKNGDDGFDEDFDADFDEKPAISISDDALKGLGVKTGKVVKKKIVKTLNLPGIVTFDETMMFTINTKFSGWVEKLYLNYEGKYVKRGDIVADIYSPEVLAAKEELLVFTRLSKNEDPSFGGMFNKDKSLLIDSAKKRLKYLDVTKSQINSLIKRGFAKRTVPIRSPYGGYVVKKLINEGVKVTSGSPLFHIADLKRVWIIADVYEQDFPYIKQGQKADISLSNMPGHILKSKVDYIYPELSGTTRTLKVRFPVNNKSGILRPGMYTQINTEFSLGKSLLVPDDGVIDDGIKKIVFVRQPEGEFVPREVILGIKAHGHFVVIKGLSEGDDVVLGASFLLDSEARLKGVEPLKVE